MIHWLSHKLGLKRCPECDTLVEYAMDGLPRPQQDKVRRHLDECPPCREQVRDYLQVQEGLGLMAPEAELPCDFNSKVLARLHQDHNHQAASADGQAEPRRHLGGWPRFWMTLGPVFAVMSLVMTFVAMGAVFSHGQGASAQADNELASIATALMNDPQAARVTLAGLDHSKGSEGQLVLCPGRSEAYFKAVNLSRCPQGRNYALWLKRGQAAPQRLARFAVESDGSSVHLLHLAQPFQKGAQDEFLVTQESGADAGQPWLKGSLSL